jgi:hypothetical protein
MNAWISHASVDDARAATTIPRQVAPTATSASHTNSRTPPTYPFRPAARSRASVAVDALPRIRIGCQAYVGSPMARSNATPNPRMYGFGAKGPRLSISPAAISPTTRVPRHEARGPSSGRSHVRAAERGTRSAVASGRQGWRPAGRLVASALQAQSFRGASRIERGQRRRRSHGPPRRRAVRRERLKYQSVCLPSCRQHCHPRVSRTVVPECPGLS